MNTACFLSVVFFIFHADATSRFIRPTWGLRFVDSLDYTDWSLSLDPNLFSLRNKASQKRFRDNTYLAKIFADGARDYCTAAFVSTNVIVLSASCELAYLSTAHVISARPATFFKLRIPIQAIHAHPSFLKISDLHIWPHKFDLAYAVLTKPAPNWVSTIAVSLGATVPQPHSIVRLMGFSFSSQSIPSQVDLIVKVSESDQNPSFVKHDRGNPYFRASPVSKERVSR